MPESGNIFESLGGPRVNTTIAAMQELRKEEQIELRGEQISSKLAFQESLSETVNPFARLQRVDKTIKAHKTRIQKMLKGGEKAARLLPIELIKDSADQFQRRNPELKSTVLLALRQMIKPGDTKEDILKKLLEFYPDVSLADEGLEFLLETTDGELAKTVQEAKDEFLQQHGREIKAGRNIGVQAREAAQKGLGTPTDLRDLYRNITGNPRDSTTLFQELSQKYVFKDLKKVTDFLLHSLGADMKSKGPSIDPGQLHRFLTETRSLQAILGVYRFFRGRMGLMDKLFQKHGMQLPSQLNFESMSKEFMGLTGERYPNGDRVLQTAVRLGIEKWIQAKIIAFSQFRDAIREVAVNQIYRSLQHRDELYLAILEALEDLEDQFEEEIDNEDDDDDDEKDDHKKGNDEDTIEDNKEDKDVD